MQANVNFSLTKEPSMDSPFRNGITADPEKIAAIRYRPKPSTTSEIRGFVIAAGYLRSLIKNFSCLAGPLTYLSVGPKNSPVNLSSEAINSIHKIKKALIIAPMVQKFHRTLPTILETLSEVLEKDENVWPSDTINPSEYIGSYKTNNFVSPKLAQSQKNVQSYFKKKEYSEMHNIVKGSEDGNNSMKFTKTKLAIQTETINLNSAL
ncbi:hypothetical protein K3495_g2861 [Podosphaera aphanis]|nr:hypothetical protein K3495_g2861 [Podosphaera aphanis]